MTEAELICELSLLQWLPRGLLFTFLQPSIPFQNQSCRSRRKGGLPPPLPLQFLADQLTLSQPERLIMPNTLIRAPPPIFRPSYGPANEHKSMNHRFDYIK